MVVKEQEMHKDVERFAKTWEEKTEAKATAISAMQAARLAEHKGEDPSEHRKIHAHHGIDGIEGKKRDEAKAIANAYIDAHPAEFAHFEDQSIESLVGLVDQHRALGQDEHRIKVDMYLLAKRPQQFIGGEGRIGG